MSIGSLGASILNHGLSALLSSFGGTQAVSGAASDNDGDFDGSTAPAAAAAGTASPSTALTGTGKAAISDQILALLTLLQQQTGSAPATPTASATGTAPASTTIATASAASDPLSQLISAMDSDGNGSISQTEMEAYVEKQGGTAGQADALFSGLNQGGTGDLTKTQLASDLQNAVQGAGGGHHHHHHHMPPSADKVANDLVSAMDSSGNGSVDSSEFQSFVTGLGGTSAQASADFAALDPNNTGSVSAAQFSSAIQAFETASNAASTASSGGSPILTLLDAFSQNTAAPGSTASVTV